MRHALAWLFDWVEPGEAKAAVLSDGAREQLRIRMNLALAEGPDSTAMPAGQSADNLLQGLLALRMKFDRETAFQKLERNLAMRGEGRTG